LTFTLQPGYEILEYLISSFNEQCCLCYPVYLLWDIAVLPVTLLPILRISRWWQRPRLCRLKRRIIQSCGLLCPHECSIVRFTYSREALHYIWILGDCTQFGIYLAYTHTNTHTPCTQHARAHTHTTYAHTHTHTHKRILI